MSSSLRKRNVKQDDHSPDSSTATDPLFVDYPSKPVTEISKRSSSVAEKLEGFLKGYTGFMGKAVNQDRGLKLLQYTLWMFSHFYKDRVVLRDALRKLYNELSFARYVLRLLGLPSAIEAAKTGSWGASSETGKGVHKFLGQILAWSMIGYYPLEHGAYLQWQTPKLLFPKTGGPSRLAEKLSAWSCRCWLAYTVAEIVQCLMKLREQSVLFKKSVKKAVEDEDDESKQKMLVQANDAVTKNLKLQIVRDLLFTLPAIHWSLPNWDTDPWLPDPFVNSLMWIETIVCMYQSITNFQQQ
jgi:hypothetical protein